MGSFFFYLVTLDLQCRDPMYGGWICPISEKESWFVACRDLAKSVEIMYLISLDLLVG